jgi:hypothetical protein
LGLVARIWPATRAGNAEGGGGARRSLDQHRGSVPEIAEDKRTCAPSGEAITRRPYLSSTQSPIRAAPLLSSSNWRVS